MQRKFYKELATSLPKKVKLGYQQTGSKQNKSAETKFLRNAKRCNSSAEMKRK
jgi:hypothetical protein